MHKLIIVLRDITENGGGERVCVNLANALRRYYNLDIEIVSLYRCNTAPFYTIDSTIPIMYLSNSTTLHTNKFKKFFNKTLYRLYLSYKAMRYIQDSHANVVLANDGTFIPFKKIDNVKYLRLWHIVMPKKKKKIFAMFDTLVILFARNITQWQSYHHNVRVIPNFLTTIPQQTTQYHQKRIIALGRMTKEKGFERLITIFAQLAKDFLEWELVIVGDGILKRELQIQINALQLQSRIILMPFTHNVESLYLSASIYAMSSYHEGFPMVLLEASSYGLPCLAFDGGGGISSIIQHEKSGYVIPDNETDTYKDTLKTLMQQIHLRESMGKYAREYVIHNFSEKAIMPLWHEVLYT